MKTVFIWGAGKMAEIVYNAIRKDQCRVKGLLDSNREIQGSAWHDILTVYRPSVIIDEAFDYLVISVLDWESIKEECSKLGIPTKKIVVFWENDNYTDIIDYNIKKIALLEKEVERYRLSLENMPWELANDIEYYRSKLPIIHSSDVLLKKVIEEKCSLCRFGDGELEIMRGKERPWFQTVNAQLSDRLKDIFATDNPKIIIALADNFGCLECYKDDAAYGIREYLSGGTRDELMKIIGTQREYYDAYVSRPYLMYKDKGQAEVIFNLFKKVWDKRKLLLVEGKNSRVGVNNDLFTGAHRIRRIICPSKNAFDKYEEIFNVVKNNITKDELVLISLGPTATVLAYDLSMLGLQALDIGQLDNEYEWFKRGADVRKEIPGKAVAELDWCHNPNDIDSEEYYEQIIGYIP